MDYEKWHALNASKGQDFCRNQMALVSKGFDDIEAAMKARWTKGPVNLTLVVASPIAQAMIEARASIGPSLGGNSH